MTGEEWDVLWHQIREDLIADGALPVEASALADVQTTEQFEPRPQEPA